MLPKATPTREDTPLAGMGVVSEGPMETVSTPFGGTRRMDVEGNARDNGNASNLAYVNGVFQGMDGWRQDRMVAAVWAS